MSYENFPVDVVVIKREDGFFVAQAKLFWKVGQDLAHVSVSGECESRDHDRAISYALAELAAKIGGGR